jgi:hypothetical protein
MRVKIECPNCEQVLFVREEEQNTMGRCPRCKQPVMLVPPAPKAAPPRAPKAAPKSAPKPAASPAKGPTVATGATKPPAAAPKPAGTAGLSPALKARAPAKPAAPAIGLAEDQDVPIALESEKGTPTRYRPSNPGTAEMQLGVAGDEDAEAAHDSFGVRGTIPQSRTGPAPTGAARSPTLVLLLGLLPFYFLYWFIVARREMMAHQEKPPESSNQFLWRLTRFILLSLLGGFYAFAYCFNLFPKRIAAMQSKCGDANRVNPGTCTASAFLPLLAAAAVVVNQVMHFVDLPAAAASAAVPAVVVLCLVAEALPLFQMQKALTAHWTWHAKRGNTSVTAGLAR